MQWTANKIYPFLGTEAVFKELKLTPFGIDIVSDVSKVPYDSLGVSDTNIAIILQMIDGSKKVMTSHDEQEEVIDGTGSQYVFQEEAQTFIEYTQQFEEPLDISQVIGVYVEECYVPLLGEEWYGITKHRWRRRMPNRNWSFIIKFVKKKAKIVSAKGAKATIKGLKKNKKYYVRIRVYKLEEGEKLTSAWSTAKSINIKK